MAYIDDVYLVVNIAPVGIPTYVRLSQNENGRRLYFAVTGGEIPSGSTATMSGTKPDGVVYSKTGSISGNTVTFNEDIQLTAVAGEWPAKIVIVNGGQTVMTARIRFVIDADTVAAGAVPSDSQLEGLVAQAAAYAEAAKDGAFYGSPLVASTVAEMTDKTRVYVYTGSESGYTSGNWYYWSGSAWTSGGVYNATAVSTDTTLSVAGKAADAKATGDAIAAVTIPTDKTLTVSDAPADAKVVGDELAALKDEISNIDALSDDVKEALLACFAKVGWIDEHGQDYYDALYDALYEGSTPPFNYGIYEPNAVVTGKYIDKNGNVQTGTIGASFYIEDYIPVIRSNYWIGMNPSSLRVPAPRTKPTNASNWRVSEYDASKRFIKQTHFESSDILCSSVLYSFDSNTKYIRLGWHDADSSTNTKEFDIEDPAQITRMPVEIGNIDASTGADIPATTRVRTVGYIDASNVLTITGCPFADSWSNWISKWTSAGYPIDSFFYVVRCYDSNKSYIGTLNYEGTAVIRQDINNIALPEGTAYIRMLFQTQEYAALSITCVNHLITINGTKYYMEGVS